MLQPPCFLFLNLFATALSSFSELLRDFTSSSLSFKDSQQL
ncbi:hypothetical protein L195_g062632, partial [Trifolium pratense]